MTPTEEKLLDALVACRDRFAFYVGHHLEKGDADKSAENYKFVALANEAIAAARQSEPPNFCARCGKRLVAGDVRTCTPPAQGERGQFAMLLQELEHLRMQAATAEKWRGLAAAKFGDGRTVQEIQREAAEAEREACLRCYSPDDTAEDWADKIRARGQQ